MIMFRLFAWSLVGPLLGGAASVVGVTQAGWSVSSAAYVMVFCWALAFFAPLAVMRISGSAARNIHAPSGATTPHKKEYSYPESLVVRGMYEDAISAFELALLEEDATDPIPYLRIARIYRDHLDQYEDSARWLKRALRDASMNSGLTTLTRKELVELYAVKMNAPEKAAPMLAQLAEEREGTPEGEWAAEELTKIKEGIAEERDD